MLAGFSGFCNSQRICSWGWGGVLTSAAPKASASEMALRIRYIKRDSKAQISRYNRRTSQDRFAINAENGFE